MGIMLSKNQKKDETINKLPKKERIRQIFFTDVSRMHSNINIIEFLKEGLPKNTLNSLDLHVILTVSAIISSVHGF